MNSDGEAAARVVAIFLSPGKRQPVIGVESARALANHGLEGDVHARPGTDRQMLLMDQESLDDLGLKPGELKESVTTAGLRLYEQPSGQLLRLGGAVLQLTRPCTPCGEMNGIRPGLQQALIGRRGYLARVVGSGDIRIADAIEPL